MSERPRRQPVVSAGRANAQSALEKLKAARDGGGAGKRVADFEVKREKAVYDVLEEDEYARLVAKRREEGGDFIVDDDGQGYADLGEEDDHWRKDADSQDDGEGGNDAGKKRKKADGKGDDKKSRKKGPAAGGEDGSGNIAKMFSKATARAALTAAPAKPMKASAAQDADALLAGILDDLGADPVASTSNPASSRAAGGLGNGGFRAGPAAPLARGPTAMRDAQPAALTRRPAAVVRPAVTASRQPTSGSSVGARLGNSSNKMQRDVVKRESAVDTVQHNDDDLMDDDTYQQADLDNGGAASPAQDVDDAGMTEGDMQPAVKAEDEDEVMEVDGEDQAALPKKAKGIGAVVADRNKAAASGWSSFCDAVDDDAEAEDEQPVQATPAVAAALPEQSDAAPQGTQPEPLADGSLPFYFLEAYENPDNKTGDVYLFGKVPIQSAASSSQGGGAAPPAATQYASTCVVVRKMYRSIIVVPRPEVFQDSDGSIAELEARLSEAQKDADAHQSEHMKQSALADTYLKQVNRAASANQEDAQQEAQSKYEAAVSAAEEAKQGHTDAVKLVAACRLELIKYLQMLPSCTELKSELRQLLVSKKIDIKKGFTMKPVKRSYAFENQDIPRGDQWCIKIRFPVGDHTLPANISGEHFIAAYGTNTPSLENLLVKRKLKGPCWTLLSDWQTVNGFGERESWCKIEINLQSSKSLLCDPHHPAVKDKPAPKITVASMNLKTVLNPITQQHEIVAAAVLYLPNCVDIEAPMDKDRWANKRVLREFCIVSKLRTDMDWPLYYKEAADKRNKSEYGRVNNGELLLLKNDERSLLTTLLNKLQAVDADVMVGHNISAGDLNLLLSRIDNRKVPMWSRIGRLKFSTMPKLTGGGHAYGGGASAGVMKCIAGRVLCDTYLSARELVREVDYTLKTLSMSLLQQDRGDLTSADIPECYKSIQGLDGLVAHTEGDAWLCLGLMFQLSILPLTRELTALSGSIWSKTLQGARAQRIEMLLLHEFHDRKYILPDKAGFKGAAAAAGKGKKGKAAAKAPANEDEDMPMDMDEPAEADEQGAAASKPGGKSKGPQYLGGLVLEPKKGLYDRLVIMLDFNSLYPSIIQEYNICFSTVTRPADGTLPPLPAPSQQLAPLPMILQGLVRKRREAKADMKTAGDSRNYTKQKQYNIKQQALKLTANSMYGCLGFTSSRFYAKPLAELITSQGRSILQSSVDLVQGTIGAEVIYGDTDSIMINTGTTDPLAARQLGDRIKKEINKRYKLLEIELDAVFKCMLLLKKKKYAAVKLEFGPNNRYEEILEQKGLDIVRRDWCGLSKEVGNKVLSKVLSCQPNEEVVEAVHDLLRLTHEDVLSGKVPLNLFVITKQLTKKPEDYADGNSQPHVAVAKRMQKANRTGFMAGDAIPYVICIDQSHQNPLQECVSHTPMVGTPNPSSKPQPQGPGTPAPTSNGAHVNGVIGAASTPAPAAHGTPGTVGATPHTITAKTPGPTPGSVIQHNNGPTGLAARAFHPEEVIQANGQLVIDTDYYLSQQVHPVVSRLVAVLDGTDAGRIAECLGLDSSKYKGGSANQGSNHYDDQENYGGVFADDEDAYKACAPLTLAAPVSGTKFEFKGALDVVMGSITHEQLLCPPDAIGDAQQTLTPNQLANQVVNRAREMVSQYYDGWLDADDELANNTSGSNQQGFRDVVLRSCQEMDRCPHPDAARHGSVLLSRRMDERRLYLQLTHFQRLLNPDLAVKRGLAKLLAQDSKCKVTEQELQGRLAPVIPALRTACQALEKLRAQSAYHWVDLGHLFGVLKPRQEA